MHHIDPLERRRLLAAAAAAVPRPDHVVIVIEENHGFADIIGNSSAPYINGRAPAGASLTAYHGVPRPGGPNCLALFSGSTQGVTSDATPPPITAPNLGAALISAGLSFVGYSESLPS